jgi:hypothetical protein
MDGVMRQHYQTNPPHRLPEEKEEKKKNVGINAINSDSQS